MGEGVLVSHDRGWRSDNQSKVHRDLSHRCLTWLANRATQRGIRGATEIQIADGYVLDALALCSLQYRRDEELSGHQSYYAFAFEVKVSRADFLSTFGKVDGKHANRHTPVANFHFCVAPRGLVKPEELPDWWGLLEAAGHGLSLSRIPKWFPVENREMDRFGHILLWVRDRWYSSYGVSMCPDCNQEIKRNG